MTNPSTILNLDYSFKRSGENKNNGNVFAVYDNVNGNRDQVFSTCDGLNRLTAYSTPGYGSMTFTYDRYGNRTGQSEWRVAPTMNLANSATTNRITTSGYESNDTAGNQQGGPGKTFQYDGESRIKTMNNGSGGNLHL